MSQFVRSVVAAGLLMASTPGWAASKGVTLQDRRQAACYNDVQRLCPNTIPDAAKAEACMKDKRSQVSKPCSALWDVKD